MEKPIILTYDLQSQCFCKYIDTFNIYKYKLKKYPILERKCFDKYLLKCVISIIYRY